MKPKHVRKNNNKHDIKEKSKNKFNIWQKFLRIFSIVLLSIFLGFSVYLCNAKNILHDPYPTVGDYGFSVIISGSMEPALNINDVAFSKAEEEYFIDDIIIYIDDNGKSAVAHRIVNIDDNGNYITKGDANNTEDNPVSKDSVRGKVIFTIPNAGILFTEVGAYILFAFILVLLGISIVFEVRYRKEKSAKVEDLQAQIDRLKAENKDTQNKQI